MEYYSAIKRNKLLIHGVMWMTLTNTLSKEARYKREYLVGFCSHKDPNQAKVTHCFLGSRVKVDCKGVPRRLLGAIRMFLYSDCGGDLTYIYVFVRTLKMSGWVLNVCKLYLNKAD